MADTVKSIFRQRKVAGEYVRDFFDNRLYLSSTGYVISDEKIGEYNINIPVLEIDEEFFLENIGQIVNIRKRLRSSDDSIIYYIDDKIVETEDDKKSIVDKYNDLEKNFNNYKREYKYKNKFFNFGTDKAPDDKNGRI